MHACKRQRRGLLVQMCGAANLQDIVPEMVQGTDQVAAWTWQTGRDHLPPFNLNPVAE